MSKVSKALAWIRDVATVLVSDRFHPARRQVSRAASTACRSLRFHSRAKIPQYPLSEVVAKLGNEAIESVVLPGPANDLGQVGDQVYYHALAAMVRALKPGSILEFGTYLGVSALTMALNAPADCRLFTVDLPDDADAAAVAETNRIDQEHIEQSRARVGEAFQRTPYKEKIVQLRADSMTFSAAKHMQNVDLVFVDGGHSLPVITKDTENAFAVLSPTGTIIWDDYFHLHPDVVRFLDRLSEQHHLLGISGTNFVVFSRKWA